MKYKYITIKSFGKSMFPLISSGDDVLIDIDNTMFSSMKIGDVAAFEVDSTMITHRIIEKLKFNGECGLVTKGDFNYKSDEDLVFQKNYLGKVIRISNSSHIFNLLSIKSFFLKILLLTLSFFMKSKSLRTFLTKLVNNHTFYEFFLFLFSEKTKDQAKENNNLEFMRYLLNFFNDGNFNKDCSWDFSKSFIDEEKIIIQLKQNKMRAFFTHLNKCSNCKNTFSVSLKNIFAHEVKRNFIKLSLLNKEEYFIETILNGKEVSFLKLKPKTFLSNGYDIDYLVKMSDFKLFSALLMSNNFFIDNIYLQEVSFKNSKFNTEIDAHFYTSMPKESIFNICKTKKLTKELISNSKNGHINREYMLFSMIVRFWTNDFHKGLKSLYEIGMSADNKEINWNKYTQISKKYDFFEESLLTLSVAENIFNKIIIPSKVISKSNKRFKFLSRYFSLERLSSFSDYESWGDENNFWTKKYLLEIHLIRLALNDHLTDIIKKPRVIILMVKCFFKINSDSNR